MSDKPDFEALRAKRNAAMFKYIENLAEAEGVEPGSIRITFDPNACYCDCPNGPCEHSWDGKPIEDEMSYSRTCSRCGAIQMFHDMRVLP